MPKKPERNRYNVSIALFVDAWMEAYVGGHDVEYVAQKLQMPVPIVQARASEYRGRGLKLKELRRRNSADLDEPNKKNEGKEAQSRK